MLRRSYLVVRRRRISLPARYVSRFTNDERRRLLSASPLRGVRWRAGFGQSDFLVQAVELLKDVDQFLARGGERVFRSRRHFGIDLLGEHPLGACPSNAILLRQTICWHLRRSRPEKILNVSQRIRLRFFRACGLASASVSFASQRRIIRTDS